MNKAGQAEVLATICVECGAEFKYRQPYDREGKPYGVIPSICFKCRDNKRHLDYIKAQEERLPEESARQHEKWELECGIPGIFIDKAMAGLEKFEKSLQPKAFKAIKEFNGKSIVLCSPELYGVGKTHLVCCLAWNLVEHTEAVTMRADGNFVYHRCPVYFTSETKILSRIRSTYNNKQDEITAETEEDVYRHLASYQVLIIDDVGKVRPKDYSFLQGVYYRIIDDRYVNEQTVILTTNLGFSDLEAHIGGACADRLRDMCGPENIIKMTGKSYRGKKDA